MEIFENSKQRDDHTQCDRIENTGQQTICHMHPEKGPIVFTTQDQLFAHFAEEHASTSYAMSSSTPKSSNPTSSSKSDHSPDSNVIGADLPSESLKNNPTEQNISGEPKVKKSKDPQDGNVAAAQPYLSSGPVASNKEKHLLSSLGVGTPPQLQHSCPVCHKVNA